MGIVSDLRDGMSGIEGKGWMGWEGEDCDISDGMGLDCHGMVWYGMGW